MFKSLSDGTKFFAFLLVWQFLFAELLFILRPYIPAAYMQSPGFIVLAQLLSFIAPLALWLAIKKERLTAHLPNMKLGRTNTWMVLGISFFLLPFMALLSALPAFFVPNVANDFLEQTRHHSLWALLLAVALTPAIVEEVVFRGYIQQQYKHWPFRRTALLNGLLFGFIHFSFQQFFYAFVMGIIFAYMVHLTRSVRSAILSHLFLNGFNIVMFRVLTYAAELNEIPQYDTAEVTLLDTVTTVGIIALVFLPFLIVLWRAFVSYNRRRAVEYDIKAALGEIG
jgi:hypothetical protein